MSASRPTCNDPRLSASFSIFAGLLVTVATTSGSVTPSVSSSVIACVRLNGATPKNGFSARSAAFPSPGTRTL